MSRNTDAPWQDEELLRQKYWEEGLSSIEIADELGCTKQCVLNWMRRFDIPRRDPTWKRPPCVFTRQDGYVECTATVNGESKQFLLHRLTAIAEYGYETVSNNHIHHTNEIPWDNRPENLEVVSIQEHPAKHAANKDAPWLDKENLVDGLKDNNQAELAEKWDCNPSMISRWRKRHGLR